MEMSIDHLRTCSYCQNQEWERIMGRPLTPTVKPTIRVKGASYRNRQNKLSELAALITGRSYGILGSQTETKGASVLCSDNDKKSKLKELGKLVRG